MASPGGNRFHLADAVAEWRSREQMEWSRQFHPHLRATATRTTINRRRYPRFQRVVFTRQALKVETSIGPKPTELYGKFTWKIENFSEITKRELRSNVFEVGGYKWYILVYPQGCDVCNHLSLFLCVADYDKLLPGWSHFAQFTIAVVNKDPKKSKYSDTLHRFCKKEHDWGWKKFMELSKVADGFTVGDTLVIKAQVQVIRENPLQPFRCLDCQYRRELVRVYITNVEGICRRFVEEKREKLGKVIEDSLCWSSFQAFWAAVEDNARRRLAREKTDVIFKAVVKRFFNEKEVTSTLVMDALYSGCKALDMKRNRNRKVDDATPIVWMEKEFFVLAGDILLVLEKAVLEPLPSYKDDKGPQNRTKDGATADEFGKDFVERDERRLTELGRRTVEMFVLAHLFSNRIEVAYREAVALKRQEELIREEEAAGQAESELKAKREAAEKEKRTKKKQAKQRRKDRKGKDKDSEKRLDQEQLQDLPGSRLVTKKILLTGSELSSILMVENGDEEGHSVVGTFGPADDLEHGTWERDASFVSPEMEASFSGSLTDETSGQSKRLPSAVDDSSSTCSSDSLPSLRPTSSNSNLFNARTHVSENGFVRGRSRAIVDGFDSEGRLLESDAVLRTIDSRNTGETSSSCSPGVDSEAVILSLKERVRWLEKRLHEKEEEVVLLHEQLSFFQQKGDQTRSHKNRSTDIPDCRFSCEVSNSHRNDSVPLPDGDVLHKGKPSKGDRQFKSYKPAANGHATENGHHVKGRTDSSNNVKYKSDDAALDSRPTSATPAFSRPGTAPMTANGPRQPMPFSVQPIPPSLSRSMSAAGRLSGGASDTSTATDAPKLPVSYRNAAVGRLHSPASEMGGHSSGVVSSSAVSNGGFARPYVAAAVSAASSSTTVTATATKLPVVYEQSQQPGRVEDIMTEPEKIPPKGGSQQQQQQSGQNDMAITFGTVTQEVLHSEHQQQSDDTGLSEEQSSDTQATTCLSPAKRAAPPPPPPPPPQAFMYNSNSLLSEDFPHLDIINDLLDDDKNLERKLSAILQPGSRGDFLHPSSGLGDGSATAKQQHHHHQHQHRRMGIGSERDNAQMIGSYGHTPLASLQSEANGRFWPMSRSMSVNGVSYSSGPEVSVAPTTRYSLVQGHHPHVLVPPDCYSVYAPLQ